jgi:hypothetical protein
MPLRINAPWHVMKSSPYLQIVVPGGSMCCSRALPSRQGVEPTDCFMLQQDPGRETVSGQALSPHHLPQSTSSASLQQHVHEPASETVLLQRNPISVRKQQGSLNGHPAFIDFRCLYCKVLKTHETLDGGNHLESAVRASAAPMNDSDEEAIRSAFGRPPPRSLEYLAPEPVHILQVCAI